ncbi:hypothetical protein HK102_008747, partial [Quaeritorhiza haematococci]
TDVTDVTVLRFRTSDFARTLKKLNMARTGVSDVGVRGGISALINLTALNLDFTEVIESPTVYLGHLTSLQSVRAAKPKPEAVPMEIEVEG